MRCQWRKKIIKQDSPFVVFKYKRLLRGRNCRFWSHVVNFLDLFMHGNKKRLLALLALLGNSQFPFPFISFN